MQLSWTNISIKKYKSEEITYTPCQKILALSPWKFQWTPKSSVPCMLAALLLVPLQCPLMPTPSCHLPPADCTVVRFCGSLLLWLWAWLSVQAIWSTVVLIVVAWQSACLPLAKNFTRFSQASVLTHKIGVLRIETNLSQLTGVCVCAVLFLCVCRVVSLWVHLHIPCMCVW